MQLAQILKTVMNNCPGGHTKQLVALTEHVEQDWLQAKQEVPLKKEPLMHFEQTWKLLSSHSRHLGAHLRHMLPSLARMKPERHESQEN